MFTETTAMEAEHWRFNSNITWHYFSSAYYQKVVSDESNNAFLRYHHLRACVYFSVCCFEAFLNKSMREKLEKAGIPEIDIVRKLRFETLAKKLAGWPSEICDLPIEVPAELIATFKSFRDIKDEVTHAKNRDHSIYVEMDGLKPSRILDALAELIITVLSLQGRAFPYWLLGWNYVGFDDDPSQPFESNNLNGFVHSLRRLNITFDNLGSDIAWEMHAMTSMKGYHELKAILSQVTVDIEPRSPRFPTRPRVTRRWWDNQIAMS